MNTIAERLEYWNREVEVSQRALAYAVGQRTLLLEQLLLASDEMQYADALTHIQDLDRQYDGS